MKMVSLGAAVAISLLLGEALTRLLVGDRAVRFPRYHTEATYGDFVLRRLRPNTVFYHTSRDGRWRFTINEQGFRDERRYGYDRREGRLRVLSLGDSQTEGFEVRQEQTFSQVTERFLRARQMDVEVFNMGVSGFSTAEELVFLENEGFRYDPDVVLVGFFANDFEDNLKARLFDVDGDDLVIVNHTHVPGVRILDVINAIPPLRWLSEHSCLYGLGMNAVWEGAKAALLRRSERRLATEFAGPTEDVSDLKKDLMAALLRRMHAFCSARGIKLIMLDIPVHTEGQYFRSSVPDDMVGEFEEDSDVFIHSERVLSAYQGLADIHVPHGQNHISEFTHALFGVAVGSAILDLARSGQESSPEVRLRQGM